MSSAWYDFAVIGAGLVGASLARGLVKQGLSVAVLDEGDIAHRASMGNFALVWVQSKGAGMPAYANWTRRSAELWPAHAEALLDETGIDVSLRQEGGYLIALSETEMSALVSVSGRVNEQPGVRPYPYEILDGNEVRRRLPGAGPAIVGAVYCPLDGHVDALRLLKATHLAMCAAGAQYLPGHGVDRIEAGDGFVIHARNGAAVVRAHRVIVAAGLGNKRLASAIGVDAPVRPQRGQIMVTQRTGRFISHPCQTLRQTEEGSVMIGDSQDDSGRSDCVRTGMLGLMARRAIQTYPAIADLNVVRTWSCLRVLTPDGYPLYQQSVEHPGAFVATCHSGVTLAAIHSGILAPAIAGGELPAETNTFHGRRFSVSQAA